MEDPCGKCLVSPMCAKICWNKANYDALLKNAIARSKQMINKKTYIHKYVDRFLKYKLKYEEHKETLNEIQSRKFKLIKDL